MQEDGMTYPTTGELDHLYEKIAAEITGLIESGTFRPGERIPSVRKLSQQRQVSISTVLEAYRVLEDNGLIDVRPQSGYYVRARIPTGLPEPNHTPRSLDPAAVSVDNIAMMVLRDSLNPNLVQFGAAIPVPELLPSARLNRALVDIARRNEFPQNICGIPQGCDELRAPVAQRTLNAGCNLTVEDILITSGCSEAMSLSLRAVCKPGDTVAVESPTYFGILQALESQGLRALEIPTHPVTGISLDALRFAIEHQPVHACLIVSNFNNPLGSCMPDEHKRELVSLLGKHEIPLLENDTYGELYFGEKRPGVAKAYDRKGLVLLCSSFSKDLSPSYRVGWVAPGRFKSQIERLKMATNIGTATLPQLAIAAFLASGGYDRHLRHIRKAYAQKAAGMAQDVLRSFPAGTHVSSPQGGFVLWVQLPEVVDALALYGQAIQAGITLAPGHIFAASRSYRNFIRLNAAYWSEETRPAIERLGRLVERASAAAR
jgi:DNA-binding transcriptional MocR family regulator